MKAGQVVFLIDGHQRCLVVPKVQAATQGLEEENHIQHSVHSFRNYYLCLFRVLLEAPNHHCDMEHLEQIA